MKKLLTVLAVVFFVSGICGHDLEFIKLNRSAGTAEKLKSFVARDLNGLISVNDSDLSGRLITTNRIGDIKLHRVAWSYKGIPVEGKYTVLKEKNGKIFKMINSMRNVNIDTTPSITANAAAKIVSVNNHGKILSDPDFISKLVIIGHAGEFRLAYKIRFRPSSPLDGRFYYVDAHNGKSLGGGNFVMKATENTAKVFETNPLRNEEPIEVELPWVSDDTGGKLTAELDDAGVRKIVATNCLDLGEKMDYYGSQYPICTPTQTANKEENGNFIYEDWTDGVAFKNDADDVYSEVAVYYHMSKIYSYILGLGIKGFTHLDAHNVGTSNNPIIGVGNFQMPQSTTVLAPMDNAFYSPHDPYFAEMFFKNFEYQGDIVVLGQGSKADFAYDGDVIYHEFGHATVESVAKLGFAAFADKYGYSNETIGLNEGMADTFSFIIAGDSCLGEYVSEAYGAGYGNEKEGEFYCLRTADNENLVNEDFIGESHHDGLPAVSAHWAMYQKVLEKGRTKDDFAKFFMESLMSVTFSDLDFKGWADVLLDTVEDTDLASLKDEFQTILEEKGFYNEVRARNIMNKAQYLFSGGVAQYQGMPSETIEVEIEGAKMDVAPMYVQLYYDVPECIDTLTITGMATDGQSMSSSSAPKYSMLVRKDNPVIWTVDDIPFKVDYDSYVIGTGSWTVKGLVPGSRYYFQFINTGPAGMLYGPKVSVSWGSEEDCTAETVDDDSETSDEITDGTDEEGDSDIFEDDDAEPVDKKEDSGCSLTTL